MMAFIVLVSGISNLILGLLVLWKNPHKRVARYFFVFTFFAFVWIFLNFLFVFTHNIVWLLLPYSAGILFALSGLLWSHELTYIKKPNWYWLLYIAGAILFVLAPFKGMMVHDIEEIFLSGFKTESGPLFIPYTIFMLIVLCMIIITQFRGYRREKGLRRVQLKTVFIGSVLFVGFVISVDFLIPSIFNYFVLASLDAPGSLILIALTTYATLKYRLMDVQVILRKGFVNFLLALFIYLMFHVIVWLFLNIFGTFWSVEALTTGFIITGIFIYTMPFIQRIVISFSNKYLYSNIYNSQETFAELLDKIVTIMDLEKIAQRIVASISKTFGVSHVVFLVKTNNIFQLIKIKGYKKIQLEKIKSILLNLRGLDEIKIADEFALRKYRLHSYGKLQNALQKLFSTSNIKAIVPLVKQKKTIGLIILGSKRGERIFTREDIDLLDSLAKQGAVAVENSLLYKDLKAKNVRLKGLLAIRGEFLNIASHQLRTPISIVRGTSKLLMGDKKLLDTKEGIDLIYAAALRLHHLVDDMLLASKVDIVDFKVNKELISSVPLKEVVEEIITSLKFKIEEKNVKIKVDVPSKYQVVGYNKYISIAIENLVDNAIKYIPHKKQGLVSVVAETAGKLVRISVTDNGIGVPKKEQAKIFDKFIRAKNALKYFPEGTGLGLFIVRRIVEAHNGAKLGFSSTPGKGSKFWLEFPSAKIGLT